MKLFLAGIETNYRDFAPAIRNTDDLFLSFFYQRPTARALKDLSLRSHTGTIIVDSGAHSFFSFHQMSSVVGEHRAAGSKHEDPDSYFDRYLEWLKKYRSMFSFAVELDLQEIVGIEKVRSWRARIAQAGLAEKVLICYHTGDGRKEFEELLEWPSRWVGLQGLRVDYDPLPYARLLRELYENGIRAHGFAFTRSRLLKEIPFYSADSSSWKYPIKYGAVAVWDEEKSVMRSARAESREDFFDNDLHTATHSVYRKREFECLKYTHQMVQYRKMNDWLTAYWRMRGVDWDRSVSRFSTSSFFPSGTVSSGSVGSENPSTTPESSSRCSETI